MNKNLTRPVTDNEIRRVIFSINPTGAPGEDGFTSRFYQFLWDTIRMDISRVIRSLFTGGRMLRSFNHTQIPKIRSVFSMTQVRPISLYTMFYKIISKILVHQLHKYMNKLINANQVLL